VPNWLLNIWNGKNKRERRERRERMGIRAHGNGPTCQGGKRSDPIWRDALQALTTTAGLIPGAACSPRIERLA
jgi:hypothetical protein